jgi:hypothetical protein
LTRRRKKPSTPYEELVEAFYAVLGIAIIILLIVFVIMEVFDLL